MAYNLNTVEYEHRETMTKKHKFYCHSCKSFVVGSANDKGIMGYTFNCPVHGEQK